MAGRIRSIKPELLEDEVMAELSDAAWRLFVSSWVLADDGGNFRASTKYLAAQVWHDTTKDAESPLRELARAGRVLVYEVEDQRYAHIPSWGRHQRIDNAGKPRVPPPPDNIREVSARFAERRRESRRAAESFGESPRVCSASNILAARPPIRPPTSDQDHDVEAAAPPPDAAGAAPVPVGGKQDSARAVAASVLDAFVCAWRESGRKGAAPKLTAQRIAKVRARLAEGFTPEDLRAAARGIWRSNWHLTEENGKHLRFDVAMRDAGQIEKFRDETGSSRPAHSGIFPSPAGRAAPPPPKPLEGSSPPPASARDLFSLPTPKPANADSRAVVGSPSDFRLERDPARGHGIVGPLAAPLRPESDSTSTLAIASGDDL